MREAASNRGSEENEKGEIRISGHAVQRRAFITHATNCGSDTETRRYTTGTQRSDTFVRPGALPVVVNFETSNHAKILTGPTYLTLVEWVSEISMKYNHILLSSDLQRAQRVHA